MTPEEVKNHFGSVRAASKAIGLNRMTIYQWIKKNEVPLLRQYQIERITNKKLKAKD